MKTEKRNINAQLTAQRERHQLITKSLKDRIKSLEGENAKLQASLDTKYDQGYSAGYSEATSQAVQEIHEHYTPNT